MKNSKISSSFSSKNISTKSSKPDATSKQDIKLVCNPTSNYEDFKQFMQNKLRSEFGEIGLFIQNNSYPDRNKEISDQNRSLLNNDKFSAKSREAIVLSCQKEYIKQSKIDSTDKVKMYGTIFLNISNDSLQLIKIHADYNQADEKNDPLLLWRIIVNTHTIVQGGKCKDLCFYEAYEELINCKQGNNEYISQYKNRFDNLIKVLEDNNFETPTDKHLSLIFINHLNQSYNVPLHNFKTAVNSELLIWPQTLADAYTKCMNFGNELIDKNNMESTGNLMLYVGRNENNNAETNNKKRKKKNKNSFESNNCRYCNEPGHWEVSCPKKLQNESNATDQTNIKQKKFKPKKIARHFTELEANALVSELGGGNDNNKKSRIEKKESINLLLHITENVVNNVQEHIHNEDKFILDTGASCNVFNSVKYIAQVFREQHTITGIGGNVQIEKIGFVPCIGKVYINEAMNVNIIASGPIYKYVYSNKRGFNVFNNILQFKLSDIDNLYTCMFNETIISKLYNYSIDNEINNTIYTVTDKIYNIMDNKFSKQQIKKAERAYELIGRLGYPSYSVLAKAINSGSIINCDITAADVVRANTIFGRPIPAIKGKMTDNKVKNIERELINIEFHSTQKLYLDIMMIMGFKFLMFVLKPINVYMASL